MHPNRRLFFVMPLAIVIALGACTDNMFPNKTHDWACFDGTIATGSICQTDNASLTYWVDANLGADGRATIDSIMHSQFGSTDLNPSYDSSPSYSGQAETDIIYEKVPATIMPTQAIGITWCEDADQGYQCDQQYIAYKTGIPVTANMACHESGHAVGLMHGSESDPVVNNTDPQLGCMRTPADDSANTLGGMNVGEIDDTY